MSVREPVIVFPLLLIEDNPTSEGVVENGKVDINACLTLLSLASFIIIVSAPTGVTAALAAKIILSVPK